MRDSVHERLESGHVDDGRPGRTPVTCVKTSTSSETFQTWEGLLTGHGFAFVMLSLDLDR